MVKAVDCQPEEFARSTAGSRNQKNMVGEIGEYMTIGDRHDRWRIQNDECKFPTHAFQQYMRVIRSQHSVGIGYTLESRHNGDAVELKNVLMNVIVRMQ